MSAVATTHEAVAGWGNCPVETCHVARPETLARLRELIASGAQPNYIARGLGRAYGDAGLNRDRGVASIAALDRILSFDPGSGRVDCQGGVSLETIIDRCLPQGWFLPTTPGTRHVSVGGAIAADVHGKNHHLDGSFGNFVQEIDLLIASGEILPCSPTANADLFWATLGGMGLTGVIVRARVQLVRTNSAWCEVTYRRTADLDETLDAFAAAPQYRYSVAWLDCLAARKSLGRAVVMLADDAPTDRLPPELQCRPLARRPAKLRGIPCFLPNGFLNRRVARAFNALYFARHGDGRRLVDYDRFFYPLDGLRHWNRIYGRRGFVQYQALFPPRTSRRGLIELLEAVADSGQAAFLAVLKASGPATPGLLSFLYPGHTIALDLPNTGENLQRLVRKLDGILLRHQGRVYLAKDALTGREAFAAMYPRLAEFQAVKARLDPNGRFSSSQARRLGIVAA